METCMKPANSEQISHPVASQMTEENDWTLWWCPEWAVRYPLPGNAASTTSCEYSEPTIKKAFGTFLIGFSDLVATVHTGILQEQKRHLNILSHSTEVCKLLAMIFVHISAFFWQEEQDVLFYFMVQIILLFSLKKNSSSVPTCVSNYTTAEYIHT